MKHLCRFAALSLLLLASGCDNQTPLGVDEAALDQIEEHRWGAFTRRSGVDVMTRNLYIGADVDALLKAFATGGDILGALAGELETLVATGFSERADAIVDEIARAKPLVIGLQEVSIIDILLPQIEGLLPEGFAIYLDFLDSLETKLADRGLNYVVAAKVENMEAIPEIVIGEYTLPIPDYAHVRLVDHDVILVDEKRVKKPSGSGQVFDNNIGFVFDGVIIERGWVIVNAKIKGKPYTIVSTHLESGQDEEGNLTLLRAAQITEIVTNPMVAAAERVILMGDLNDWPGTLMYQILTQAGFVDVWSALRPWMDGYTCCHAKELWNPIPQMTERIDYIWTRGMGEPRGWVYRTGILPWEQVDGPFYKLWPSDHAGLVASLQPPRRHGLIARR